MFQTNKDEMRYERNVTKPEPRIHLEQNQTQKSSRSRPTLLNPQTAKLTRHDNYPYYIRYDLCVHIEITGLDR